MSMWSSHGYVVSETVVPYSNGAMTTDHYRSYRLEPQQHEEGKSFGYVVGVDDDAYYVRGNSAVFCTKDNILNSVAYINQELQLLGLPLFKYDGSQCSTDVIFFINRVYDLLTLHHKTSAVKEDLENRNHRLSCESDHHQSTVGRLKRLQENSERELDQEREKFRQINLKYKQVCSKLKLDKEEVKRLTGILHSKDLQHKHEQKKKEREVHKLKERLHQLLADKAPDRKVGMDLMNVVGRNEGRRATWKSGPGKQEEEMYQILINNYEDRHRELMQENSELRDCLLSLQRELSALLKRTGNMAVTHEVQGPQDLSVSSEEELSGRSRLSVADLDEGYFQMPCDIVRQEIERTFKETCDQISDSMKKSLGRYVSKRRSSVTYSKSGGSNSSELQGSERRHSAVDVSEIERLRKQIGHYKDIIQQQEELIQQSLDSHSQSVENTFLHESQLLKDKEHLAEQKKLFVEEKGNFEKERKAFTEAAIRLGKERHALQEERAKILKQHFLNISPFKENHPKKFKGDGPPSRLLPATPVFSPAKSGTKKSDSSLPTTAELYKVLGLSPVPKSPERSSGDQHERDTSQDGSIEEVKSVHLSTAHRPITSDMSTMMGTVTTALTITTTATAAAAAATTTSSLSPSSEAAFDLQKIKASLLSKKVPRFRPEDP